MTIFTLHGRGGESSPWLNLTLTANKLVFRPADVLEVRLIVEADRRLENVTLLAWGILTQENLTWFKRVAWVQLRPGQNVFDYSLRLPTCYACEKIRPGKNYISGMVVWGGIVQNASLAIDLVG
jgi:hypothetical protein